MINAAASILGLDTAGVPAVLDTRSVVEAPRRVLDDASFTAGDPEGEDAGRDDAGTGEDDVVRAPGRARGVVTSAADPEGSGALDVTVPSVLGPDTEVRAKPSLDAVALLAMARASALVDALIAVGERTVATRPPRLADGIDPSALTTVDELQGALLALAEDHRATRAAREQLEADLFAALRDYGTPGATRPAVTAAFTDAHQDPFAALDPLSPITPGTEVWIEFEEGDLSRPVWAGLCAIRPPSTDDDAGDGPPAEPDAG